MKFTLSAVFWLGVAMDVFLLGVFALLALAASGQAKPGYAWDMILWMGVLPVAVIATAIFMFHRLHSPAWKILALLLVFAPWLVVGASKARDVYDDMLYEGHFFKAGPTRELELAVQRGDTERVAQLAKTVDVNQRGHVGMTLLILTLKDRKEVPKRLGALRELLAAKADPNIAAGYALPLELACSLGIEPVRLLVNAGADPNRITPDGRPAYFAAIGLPIDRAILPLLVARGVDRTLKDNRGRTAAQVAQEYGDQDAVRLLTSP